MNKFISRLLNKSKEKIGKNRTNRLIKQEEKYFIHTEIQVFSFDRDDLTFYFLSFAKKAMTQSLDQLDTRKKHLATKYSRLKSDMWI